MLSRLLPALLLMMPLASDQHGFYGAATGHPKAGDAAPNLVFSQVLSAPTPNSPSSPNLSGQVTVLGFFPDTSHNPNPVALWNARVDQFADKHVQFVWITGEDKQTLLPALAQHPIKGWVVYDPNGATAKAYGLDQPMNIYIGPDRKIAGFQMGIIPDDQTLNAVLDHRIVLTRPTPVTMMTFLKSNMVALDSTPARMPSADDYRPHLTPSYTVHITPSTADKRGNFGADDYWVLQGVTLKQAIEELYGLNSIRIEVPASLSTTKRYDFAMLLPHLESREQMKDRFKQALQDYFHLTVDHDVRLTNVYVVSRDPGHKPSLEKLTGLDQSRNASVGLTTSQASEESILSPAPVSLDALVSVSEEGTMDDFCHDLEGSLDRPVVNETHMDGLYRFQVELPANSKASFLTILREQTGLVISPARRNITFLRFRSTGERPVAHLTALH